MSVIPELVIQRAVVEGIRAIRRDSRLMDTIFRDLDQGTLQAMKDFILKESISFHVNYPRNDTLKVPSLVLLMKGENEGQTFLGDIMGAPPYYDMPDDDLVYDDDVLGGNTAASVSKLSGLPPKVVGPLRVHSVRYRPASNTTTITFSTAHTTDFECLKAYKGCMDVYTVAGSGSGQTGRVLKIGDFSLDIEGRFDPQLDSSTLVDLREVRPEDRFISVGEPSRVYPASASNLLRKGANYEVQYQLSVIAGQQDQVIYLYSVLKAIMFHQKAFMEKNGLMALKISGSDFSPRSEYLPSEVFQRIMTLAFTYPFTYLEEQETFKYIELCMTPRELDGTECCTKLCITIDVEDGGQ